MTIKTIRSNSSKYSIEVNDKRLTVNTDSNNEKVRIEIYEAGCGYGMGENPSRQASLTLTVAEWNEFPLSCKGE